MFCQVCGAQINDDAAFCPACGTTLKITPPRPKEVKPPGQGENGRNAVCPFCGFEYYSRSDFCPRCGMDKKSYSNGADGQNGVPGFDRQAEGLNEPGGPNGPGAGSWAAEQNPYERGFNKYGYGNSQSRGPERDFEKDAMPQSRGPERDFQKYAMPQSDGPERDFEKYASPGASYDFEKYADNAGAPRKRGHLVLIIVGALLIVAAAAAAIYFLLLR